MKKMVHMVYIIGKKRPRLPVLKRAFYDDLFDITSIDLQLVTWVKQISEEWEIVSINIWWTYDFVLCSFSTRTTRRTTSKCFRTVRRLIRDLKNGRRIRCQHILESRCPRCKWTAKREIMCLSRLIVNWWWWDETMWIVWAPCLLKGSSKK